MRYSSLNKIGLWYQMPFQWVIFEGGTAANQQKIGLLHGVDGKKKALCSQRASLWYWATTYSPTGQGSTIGAVGLNFSVRNGKRCAPTL